MLRPIGALLLGCVVGLAQESRSTIAGIITDSMDAGIPKARVVISNVETGVDTVLFTNERGVYVAPLLLPGIYRVSAEREGFKKSTRDGITLSVNDNQQIDLRLEL